MKLLLLLLPAVVAGSFRLDAQRATDVYPVRANHKSGYIHIWKSDNYAVDTAIPPRYDVLADVYLRYNEYISKADKRPDAAKYRYSPFKLFEIDGKVGLVDRFLKPVIAGDYKRIRPLTPRYFAVEIDSLFTVVDRSGRVMLENAHYSDIYPLRPDRSGETEYFLVKRGRKLGIHKKSGGLLVYPRFERIEPAGHPDYFKVREEEDDGTGKFDYWNLVNPKGDMVSQAKYRDVVVLSDSVIAFKPLPERDASDSVYTWQLKLFNQISTYKELNLVEGFMPVLTKGEFNPNVRLTLDNYKSIRKLNNHTAVIQPMDGIGVNLLLDIPEMKVLANDTFVGYDSLDETNIIAKASFNRFAVRDLAILGPGGKVIMPATDYLEILPSGKEGFYRVRRDMDWGLLSVKNGPKEVIPCAFSYIDSFENNIVLCRLGRERTAFCFTDTLTDSLKYFYQELLLTDDGSLLARKGSDDAVDYTVYTVDEHGKFHREIFNEKTMRDGVDLPELLLVEAKDEDLASVYIPPALWADSVFYTELNAPPEIDIFGIRPFKNHDPLTAFIDADGSMGLMDRNGRQKRDANGRPLRFTYIGQFVGGRARVCTGGVLRSEIDESYELNQRREFIISTETALFAEFSREQYGRLRDTAALFYKIRSGGSNNKTVYAVPSDDAGPPQWGFIDPDGRFTLQPRYGFVYDYNPADSIALLLNRNAQDSMYINNAVDYGCADYQGNVLLPVQYSLIRTFKEYFLVALDSTPTLHFNNQGRQLIVNRTRPRGFAEGLYCFKEDSTGKWGYIDIHGEKVIPAQYDTVHSFSEGLASVADTSGHFIFINKKGETVFTTGVPKKYPGRIGKFKSGRCRIKKENKWGYLDTLGREAIRPMYLHAQDFCGTGAIVEVLEANSRQVAVIDTANVQLLPPGFAAAIDSFDRHGIARFQDKSKKWGLVNNAGKVLLAPNYARPIKPFVNGYAHVSHNGVLWGLVDTRGREVAPTKYARIDTVSEGIFAYKHVYNGDWSYWNLTTGKPIKGSYKTAKQFKNGHALVNGKTIINRDGDVILNTPKMAFFSEGIFGTDSIYMDPYGNNLFMREFIAVQPFKSGVAKVKLKDKPLFAAINKRGIVIVPPKYRQMMGEGNNIILNPNYVYGLVDRKGKNYIVEPRYDRISRYPGGVHRLEFGEKIGYGRVDEAEKFVWLWPLQF